MCDVERIAFYINDDLPDAERAELQKHFSRCEACRSAAAQLRGDAGAVGAWYRAPASGEAVSHRTIAPARRRWLPVAAVLAVLMLTMGAARVDAVGARLVKLFPFLHVRVMPAEEATEYANRRVFLPPGISDPPAPPPWSTVDQAEQEVGFRLARVTYLPGGFTPDNFSISRFPGATWVTQLFTDHGALLLALTQEHDSGPGRRELSIPDGQGQEVKVRGEPAMLINGVWLVQSDGSKVWDSEGSRYLWFQWNGQTMSISVHRHGDGAPLLSGAELIKMAESLQ